MVNRVNSPFPAQTENNMNKHIVKRHRNSDTQNRQQRTTTELPTWNGQLLIQLLVLEEIADCIFYFVVLLYRILVHEIGYISSDCDTSLAF